MKDDQGDIEPVDVLVPVGAGYWLVGDVRFLGNSSDLAQRWVGPWWMEDEKRILEE